jgi:hypothetical protein
MKKSILTSIILISASVLTFESCKKAPTVDNETQSVVDNAICEQQFMTIAPNVNSKGSGSPKNLGFKTTSTCGTWSVATTNMSDTITDAVGSYTNGPVTFEINYAGCTDNDGITKSGKIIIKSTHKWSVLTGTNTAVATTTVSFNNYTVDGVLYDGSVIITKSANTLTTKVIGGHCTSNSWNIYYDCDKTLTKNTNGDFTISGTSNGTNREGRKFTTTITTPLFKPTNYKFITSGTLELTPDGFKTRTVDFGNGTLDDQATFTVDGQTFTFTMK